MANLFIGLMSGTSLDGIDAALVDFSDPQPKVIATHYAPYSQEVREKILALCQTGENEIQRMGELDVALGKAFAQAANQLLSSQSFKASDIQAIGSHGQTIRHYPQSFTLQIGDPNIIAAETGITTVADFRRKDIAYGGHGAPLVPAFHQQIFSDTTKNRVIVNIGGIANITLLSAKNAENIIGFDTGPGNVLMDAWITLQKNESHDKNGAWAATGKIQQDLLQQLLSDQYFQLPAPKSTGREHFNLAWLKQQLSSSLNGEDVQATLAELTARTIFNDIQKLIPSGEILVCGGGTHNAFLMSRLTEIAKPHFSVASTKQYGVDPDWVEALAFAWLARQTLKQRPGNLPSVTGAKKLAVLGGIYYA